ncbi:hypothetical protein U1Q18_051984 [Sarracenia purpurea var. burkii]
MHTNFSAWFDIAKSRDMFSYVDPRIAVLRKEFRNPEPNVNSVGLDFVNPLQEAISQPSRYSIFSSAAAAASTKQPESVVTFEPLPRVLPNKSNPRLPQFNVYSDGVGVSQDWLGK